MALNESDIKSIVQSGEAYHAEFKTKGMFNIVFRRSLKGISQKTSVKIVFIMLKLHRVKNQLIPSHN